MRELHKQKVQLSELQKQEAEVENENEVEADHELDLLLDETLILFLPLDYEQSNDER